MAIKKKQHYVPKAYMKHFTKDDKKFAIVNIRNNSVIEGVPYADQCYENYYYGTDLTWEDRLGELETSWGTVFSKVRNEETLSKEEITLLKQFAVYQRQRTLAEGNYRKEEKISELKELARLYCVHKNIAYDNQQEEKFMKIAKDGVDPIEILKIALDAEELIEDLELKIICYKTTNKLVSSDVPVILINRFEEHAIGYSCMGLILFFPVGNDKMVVIYDRGMYAAIGTEDEQYIVAYDENEIVHLNIMQYISAEKIIYAQDKEDLLFINEDVKTERAKNRSQDPVQKLGTDNHEMLIYSNRRVIHECDLSFARLGHAVRKIPYPCREAVPRIYENGWQKKLYQKEEIFPAIMKQIPGIKEDMNMTIKDAKRGCKQMTRFAEIYWQTNRTFEY